MFLCVNGMTVQRSYEDQEILKESRNTQVFLELQSFVELS